MRFPKAAIAVWALALAAATRSGAGTFAAVPLPDPQVPGFHFPESEATILSWVREMESGSTSSSTQAFDAVHLHGWGIWTALTQLTNELDAAQRLRVFETWYTPQELANRPNIPILPDAPAGQRTTASLLHFSQFRLAESIAQAQGGSETVFGYVRFDPTAVDHIQKEQLLTVAGLNSLIQGGADRIPAFPPTAMSLKSAFQVITRQTLVRGRYYRLNAWPGPPPAPQAWGPSSWPGVVWVDILGGGHGAGGIDMIASVDGSSRTDDTTYPVSAFINHRLSAGEATQFNEEDPGAGSEVGDYAILVAMHVAGKELTRWTWQTFWWTPTPDNPQLPSSAAIAALRPSQLAGPARNYAMALGYDMETPGQPNVGGSNSGYSIYAYNPWLEARFGPANLPDSLPGLDPSGRPAPNNVGVQCNCMSCHARANYNPNSLAGAPAYSGDRYVSLNDPQFAGTLQLDFLWSLAELAQ